MKLAYVTTYDVNDRPAWARTLAGFGAAGYYFTRALERQGVEIVYLGSLRVERSTFGTLKRHFYGRVLGQRYHADLATAVYRSYAQQVAARLRDLDVDLVLSQESGAIAYLGGTQPVALWTDAPYAAVMGSYDFATGLCRETRRALVHMERAAVGRAALVMYASEWAAEAAKRSYGLDDAKVHVVPWGANLDRHPAPNEVERLIEARPPSPCRLVFCGLDWERKRGDLTIAIAETLNRRGIPTELTLIGTRLPPGTTLPSFVTPVGFVDVATSEGRRQIDAVIARAHFLLLPSRAETFGHVLCEANAFGVPCLASAVGGIPTAIRHGVNGRLHAAVASAEAYADDIESFMRDREAYRALARSSFAEFQARLSYDAAATAVRALIEPLRSTAVAHAPARSA